MQFIDLAKKRRSVRSYLNEQVKKEDLEKIIEAGIYAPSAFNKQAWKFLVLKDQEKIQKASQAILEIKLKRKIGKIRDVEDPIFYSAPCVVFICMEKPKNEYAQADTAFCMQNCFLQAAELDLATCAIGPVVLLEERADIKEDLGFDKNWEIVMAFCLGKSSDKGREVERKEPDVIFN